MNEQIAALQARIAELREALNSLVGYGELSSADTDNYQMYCEMPKKEIVRARKTLSRPDGFSALNEAKAKVLEDKASALLKGLGYPDDNLGVWYVNKLRAWAQEIREGK